MSLLPASLGQIWSSVPGQCASIASQGVNVSTESSTHSKSANLIYLQLGWQPVAPSRSGTNLQWPNNLSLGGWPHSPPFFSFAGTLFTDLIIPWQFTSTSPRLAKASTASSIRHLEKATTDPNEPAGLLARILSFMHGIKSSSSGLCYCNANIICHAPILCNTVSKSR